MEGISTDDILNQLNPFGRVQVWFSLCSAYLQFFLPMNSQSINFLGATPVFHCSAREGYPLNESVPLVEDENGEIVFSQCQEYTDPGNSNATQDCQNGWTYSQEFYGETIITEWDLVCAQSAAAETSQSVQQVGGVIGCILFGMLADRYGRRPSFLAALILCTIAGIALSFSPNYVVFVIIRFFCGLSQMATWVVYVSLISEYMIPKYRNRAMTVPVITFSFGLTFMSLMAFLIRDWRYLQLALVSPMILAIFASWFLPESLRWTMSRNKNKAVQHLVHRLAKINNKPFAEEVILSKSGSVSSGSISTISGRKDLSYPSSEIENNHTGTYETKVTVEPASSKTKPEAKESNVETKTANPPKTKRSSYLDLFKPPVLHVSVVIAVTRFTFTFIYFGFALSTGRLAGNPYLNFFFSAMVEIPARLLSPPLYQFMRRTYLMSLSFTVCGAGLIVIMFVPERTKNGVDLQTLRTILSLSGKFFVTLALGGILLLAAELFPTTLRNRGNGFTLSVGRVGAIIAPFVLYLDNLVFEYFSATLMAVSSLITAAIILTLPDTRRTTQPQNASDLKLIMSSRRKEPAPGLVNDGFSKDN